MSSSEILQEYLVQLGYKTDITSFKKMDINLSSTTKKMLGVGSAITGIVAATAAATASFSYNMRKMYFASELSNSSVKNLKGLEYAGKQIGVSGDAMESSIHAMAQSLRLQPGLQAFLNNLGVKTTGRDASDVMVDMVSALKDMPEFQATQIAGMFGISPDDYHQMASHLDDLKAKKQDHLELAKKMNVDMDDSKKVILHYTEELDKMGAMLDMLGYKALSTLVPAFDEASKYIDGWIEGMSFGLDHLSEEWDKFIDNFSPNKLKKDWEQFKSNPIKAIFSGSDESKRQQKAPAKTDESKRQQKAPAKTDEANKQAPAKTDEANKQAPAKTVEATQNSSQQPAAKKENPSIMTKTMEGAKDYLSNLSNQYSLPEGMLYKVFGVESAYGKNVDSPVGAQGPFQFMPETSKAMGIKNPYDFEESAGGAAKMYKRLMDKYKQSPKLASAAYNWGEGNVDAWLKTGKGKKGQPMPKETMEYMEKVGGGYGSIQNDNKQSNLTNTKLGTENNKAQQTPNITQTNTFHITGNDSKQIADSVAEKQARVNADTVRQFKGVYQ